MRKFSSELQFKSLEDLKSSKLIGDGADSDLSSLVSTNSDSSSGGNNTRIYEVSAKSAAVTTNSNGNSGSNSIVVINRSDVNVISTSAVVSESEATAESSQDEDSAISRVTVDGPASVDENALFQSLEPAECAKVEDEFDRMIERPQLAKKPSMH